MRQPPALANWLVTRFGLVEDALVGDLYQEWSAGRTIIWFWHQAVAAITWGTVRQIRSRPARTCTALLSGWLLVAAIFLAGDTVAEGLAGLISGWHRQDAYLNHHWGPFYVGAVVVCFGGFSASAWLVARLHRRTPAMLVVYVAATFALLLATAIVMQVLGRRGDPIPIPHPMFYAIFTTLPFVWHSGVVLVPLAMLVVGGLALPTTSSRCQSDSR